MKKLWNWIKLIYSDEVIDGDSLAAHQVVHYEFNTGRLIKDIIFIIIIGGFIVLISIIG